jgi:predicted amidohydrolase YtcJ
MYDIIFNNANIITMDPSVPSARLVTVKGEYIAAVADAGGFDASKEKGSKILDCCGKTMIPGFIDAHCHISAYAESLVTLNLSPRAGVRSISDIKNKIQEHCLQVPARAWVRGKGYNEFYIEENRHPNRWDLDAAAPENPVKLTHRSGHAHVLNTLALEYVGIKDETGDPPGGLIERDPENGLPTGILYGMSRYLAGKIPSFENEEIERGLKLADTKLLSYGITSVQDASFSNNLKQWKRFESWKERNILHPRVTMMLGVEAFTDFDAQSYASTVAETELRLSGVKIIAGQETGSLQPSQTELNRMIASILAAGFQPAIHAVEEPVIEAAIKGYEYALRLHSRADSRHRVEHCSVCSPALLQKLASLGGVVVTQPAFLFYEGERYLKTVPADQLKYLYPIDSMLKNNLRVAFGSDLPIVDPNPMIGIGTAVTRRSENGSRLPGQGIGLYDAIRMYTLDAAAANFEESLKGSISPGKLADFVLLSEDPFSVSADRVKDIRVVMTVVGGRIVWNEFH